MLEATGYGGLMAAATELIDDDVSKSRIKGPFFFLITSE